MSAEALGRMVGLMRAKVATLLISLACRLLEGETRRWVILNTPRKPNVKGSRIGHIEPFVTFEDGTVAAFSLAQARKMSSLGQPLPAGVARLAGKRVEVPG